MSRSTLRFSFSKSLGDVAIVCLDLVLRVGFVLVVEAVTETCMAGCSRDGAEETEMLVEGAEVPDIKLAGRTKVVLGVEVVRGAERLLGIKMVGGSETVLVGRGGSPEEFSRFFHIDVEDGMKARASLFKIDAPKRDDIGECVVTVETTSDGVGVAVVGISVDTRGGEELVGGSGDMLEHVTGI